MSNAMTDQFRRIIERDGIESLYPPQALDHAMPTPKHEPEKGRTIKGVEIFSSGTHNSDSYTTKDLDDMIAAFKELDYTPALKIGHGPDEPGARAHGWVTNLRRIGTKLVADFTDIAASTFEKIKARGLDRVSSEIYFNLKRGGKVFRRALKAVALLGAEVPAVAGLAPLHKMLSSDMAEAIHAGAALALFAEGTEHDSAPAGEVLHAAVAAYREQNPGMSYSDAMNAVLSDNTSLHEQYATLRHDSELSERQRAGARIQELADAIRRANPGMSLEKALGRVMQEHPDLANRYRDAVLRDE